jgi:mono/diheme cytochrome c family protein
VRRASAGLGAAAIAGATALLVLRGLAATPAPPAGPSPGQALYATHCAVCHGESGRGDGSSAASFASKPSNLTNGHRFNQLPEGFFINVILNGGPAEGLSPGMPPFRGNLNEEQILQIVAFLRSLADPPFRPVDPRPIVTAAGAPRQPIFFSHLIHAGSYRIDCQYCHADARRSPYAGVPSVDRCMGCHKIIGAQDNPEIRKIHQYWEKREPIPWVRIFKIPEFTYFAHKPHVQAGLPCQGCHGPIQQMRVVGARTGPSLVNDLQNLVGLRPSAPPFTMGWCIDCHREQNRAMGRQAPLDCVACHH